MYDRIWHSIEKRRRRRKNETLPCAEGTPQVRCTPQPSPDTKKNFWCQPLLLEGKGLNRAHPSRLGNRACQSFIVCSTQQTPSKRKVAPLKTTSPITQRNPTLTANCWEEVKQGKAKTIGATASYLSLVGTAPLPTEPLQKRQFRPPLDTPLVPCILAPSKLRKEGRDT